MRIILTADMKKVGKRGEVKQVADGYARNYLIPRGLAVAATAGAVAEAEKKQEAVEKEAEKKTREVRELAKKYSGKKFRVKVAAGEKGELFGSVGKREIGEAAGVSERAVKLVEPIKAVGEYEVEIQFSPEATVKIIIEVVKEK